MCSGNECALFLIPVFPLFFGGLWFGICMLLAKAGGWTVLAEKYRVEGDMPQGVHLHMSSAVFRKNFPVNYQSSLNITITNDGLGMAPMWFFRLHHEPIFIPWKDMDYSEGTVIQGKSAILDVRGMDIRITFWGKKLVAAVKEHK